MALAGKKMLAPQLHSSEEEEEEEEEEGVLAKARGQTSTAGRKRRLIESSEEEEEEVVLAKARGQTSKAGRKRRRIECGEEEEEDKDHGSTEVEMEEVSELQERGQPRAREPELRRSGVRYHGDPLLVRVAAHETVRVRSHSPCPRKPIGFSLFDLYACLR
jgi:hypothetical protein